MILIFSIVIVGSVWHLSVKEASRGTQTMKTFTIFAQKSEELDIKLVSQGKSVDFHSLPEPLFVTFGNEGFQDLLSNFVCNLLTFPSMLKHTFRLGSIPTISPQWQRFS